MSVKKKREKEKRNNKVEETKKEKETLNSLWGLKVHWYRKWSRWNCPKIVSSISIVCVEPWGSTAWDLVGKVINTSRKCYMELFVCVEYYKHFATPETFHLRIMFAKYEVDCLKSVYQVGYVDT
jgi:hypothetical protein